MNRMLWSHSHTKQFPLPSDHRIAIIAIAYHHRRHLTITFNTIKPSVLADIASAHRQYSETLHRHIITAMTHRAWKPP
jgi:hypothetical protein